MGTRLIRPRRADLPGSDGVSVALRPLVVRLALSARCSLAPAREAPRGHAEKGAGFGRRMPVREQLGLALITANAETRLT